MRSTAQTMTWIKDQKIHQVLHHTMCVFMNLWNAESKVKRIFRTLRNSLKKEFTAPQLTEKKKASEDMTVFWFRSSQKILKQHWVHWTVNYLIDCRLSYLWQILYERMVETNSNSISALLLTSSNQWTKVVHMMFTVWLNSVIGLHMSSITLDS
jgi:hypothetical protein